MDRPTTTVILKLPGNEKLEAWEVSFEVEAMVETRDRLGNLRGGWQVSAPVDDHYPPHVHCRNGDVVVAVYLDDDYRVEPKGGKLKENDRKRLVDGLREDPRIRRAYDDVVRKRNRC